MAYQINTNRISQQEAETWRPAADVPLELTLHVAAAAGSKVNLHPTLPPYTRTPSQPPSPSFPSTVHLQQSERKQSTRW